MFIISNKQNVRKYDFNASKKKRQLYSIYQAYFDAGLWSVYFNFAAITISTI